MTAYAATRVALNHVMRLERGRLLAGLVSRFGAHSVDIAEDAVQEAFVVALETWAFKGLPDNAGAMLMRVASHKMIDRLRREGRETTFREDADTRTTAPEPAGQSGDIADPDLRLIVLCCTPILGETEQLTLTLKLASGFTAAEIAPLLFTGDAAVGQRVARGLRKLRHAGTHVVEPPDSAAELRLRLPRILRTLYVLYSLGFMPRSGDRAYLNDMCLEALRLAELIARHSVTGTPESQALAALLCLHSARLTSRTDADGNLILLKAQDRRTWSADLIQRGQDYLQEARRTGRPSRYHLEAAIAGAHAVAQTWQETDWNAIVLLYRALETVTQSPVVAVNVCVAQAMNGDPEGALERLQALGHDERLAGRYPIGLARGEILMLLHRTDEACHALDDALQCALSTPMRAHIEARRTGLAVSGLV